MAEHQNEALEQKTAEDEPEAQQRMPAPRVLEKLRKQSEERIKEHCKDVPHLTERDNDDSDSVGEEDDDVFQKIVAWPRPDIVALPNPLPDWIYDYEFTPFLLRYDTLFRGSIRTTYYRTRTSPPPPPPPPLPGWPLRRRGHSGCRLTARWPCGDREEAVEVAGQSRGGWYPGGRRRRAPRMSPAREPQRTPPSHRLHRRHRRRRCRRHAAPAPETAPVDARANGHRRNTPEAGEHAARDERIRRAAISLAGIVANTQNYNST